jgi:hypothetical protein
LASGARYKELIKYGPVLKLFSNDNSVHSRKAEFGCFFCVMSYFVLRIPINMDGKQLRAPHGGSGDGGSVPDVLFAVIYVPTQSIQKKIEREAT